MAAVHGSDQRYSSDQTPSLPDEIASVCFGMVRSWAAGAAADRFIARQQEGAARVAAEQPDFHYGHQDPAEAARQGFPYENRVIKAEDEAEEEQASEAVREVPPPPIQIDDPTTAQYAGKQVLNWLDWDQAVPEDLRYELSPDWDTKDLPDPTATRTYLQYGPDGNLYEVTGSEPYHDGDVNQQLSDEFARFQKEHDALVSEYAMIWLLHHNTGDETLANDLKDRYRRIRNFDESLVRLRVIGRMTDTPYRKQAGLPATDNDALPDADDRMLA